MSGRFYSSEVMAGMLSETSEGYTTIYRGLSGSESGSGALFMAEDASYAAGYAKNGVGSFSIPSQSFNILLKEGLIETRMGINSVTGQKGLEYVVSNPALREADKNNDKIISMKYCCRKFETDLTLPANTSPNIRMVKFKTEPLLENKGFYGFYTTTGYQKFSLHLPKMTISFCPYCGTELKHFYKSDDYGTEFEGQTF